MSNSSNDAIKTCCRCKLDFPASAEFFHPGIRTKDGLRKRCKKCSDYNGLAPISREKDGLYRCGGCKEYLAIDLFTVRDRFPSVLCRDCTFHNREKDKKNGLSGKSVSRVKDGRKECTNCSQFKELSEFYIFKSGMSCHCKECCKARSRRNREQYKENGKICKSRAKYSSDERKQRRSENAKRWSQKRSEENKNKTVATEKTCPRCDRTLAAALFKKRPYNVDGLALACSRCEYQRERKSESVRKSERWWVYMHSAISRRAKDKGEESDITKEFLRELFEKQNGLCYWFGIPLVPTAENRHPQKPSLDRIDCSKGYNQDNVVLACHAANMGRNSSTFQQFTDFVAVLKSSFSPEV